MAYGVERRVSEPPGTSRPMGNCRAGRGNRAFALVVAGSRRTVAVIGEKATDEN